MIFLNSTSSAAALVFYLPDVCTHTDTEGKKQRKARGRNILKSSEKNTIFNEHPVYFFITKHGGGISLLSVNKQQLQAAIGAQLIARQLLYKF